MRAIDVVATAAINRNTSKIYNGYFGPTPDHRSWLAWTSDTSGAEVYQLRVRDLRTGQDRPDLIERSYPGVAWSADSRYLFYLVPDEVNRPFQVWRHRLGADPADDVLIFAEDDARFEITLRGSRSGEFAVIESASRDTTEVRLVPLADPLKRREVPGHDPASYRTERVTAPARDGTPIPVTLACHATTPLDGTAPCLLYGYGAYEACCDPEFSIGLPSLLDRGVVYAIAHVRGGGEGGRNWWFQGRLRAKPTTFTDYIDVADWLAGDGSAPALVDGRRIVSRGLSAGGLLQGAVYSMRPDRWRAVVAEVPFVDCVTTMLDPSIPLTINEWDEWGDPRDPGDYACIRSYSPYDNPPKGRRPALLVTGAVHDPRVSVHEPAKWVARLRATEGSDEAAGRLLFRVEQGVGAHTGPSGRYAQARYEAEVHAFVLNAMDFG